MLALNEEEYFKYMRSDSEFYQKYIHEVQEIIAKYTDDEFECLWNEKRSSNKHLSELSDSIAYKITKLKDTLKDSNLWKNKKLRERIITEGIVILNSYNRQFLYLATPPVLIRALGIEKLIERIPDIFIKRIFSIVSIKYQFQ